MFLVQLNVVPTKMLGESGASVNVIDEPDMQPLDMKLYAYRYLECSLVGSQLNSSHTQ